MGHMDTSPMSLKLKSKVSNSTCIACSSYDFNQPARAGPGAYFSRHEHQGVHKGTLINYEAVRGMEPA